MPGKRRIAIDPTYEEDSKESEQTKHITKITKTITIAEHINGTVKEKMIIEQSDVTTQVKSGESINFVQNKSSVDKKPRMPAKMANDQSDVKREAGRPKAAQKDEKNGKDKSPNAKPSTSKLKDNQKPKSPNEKGKKITSKETEDVKAGKANNGLISDIARKESIGKGKDNAKEKSKGYGKYQKMNRNRAELVSKLDNYKPVDQVIELGDGKINNDTILISSWNVAGLYNILKGQHLHNYVKDRQPDILCLNETKLTEDFIKGVGSKWIPEGYSGYFNCCKIRSWYSGTALITKHKPISVTFDIGIKKHALEGRTITVEFEHFYLVASYVPNAGDGLVGLKYRVEEWDPDFKNYVCELKKKKHVVICGDLNCAYQDIDIHNPKGKEKFAGFSPEERKSFGELLNTGFVDTFRHLHPAEKKFSFFSQKLNNRPKNLGWRLDYFLVDKEGISGVRESLINDKIYGSDHLPIELTLKPNFN